MKTITRLSDGWGKELTYNNRFSKSTLKAIKRRLNQEYKTHFTCFFVVTRKDGTRKVIELPY